MAGIEEKYSKLLGGEGCLWSKLQRGMHDMQAGNKATQCKERRMVRCSITIEARQVGIQVKQTYGEIRNIETLIYVRLCVFVCLQTVTRNDL